MGYDIVMTAERRFGDTWELDEPMVRNHSHKYDPSEPEYLPRMLDLPRDRWMFRVLAGFGGPHEFTISEPRGFPEGANEVFVAWADNGVGCSWLHADELRGYEHWDKLVQHEGYLPKDVAPRFQGNPIGSPTYDHKNGYSRGPSGFNPDGVLVKWRQPVLSFDKFWDSYWGDVRFLFFFSN